MLNQTIDTLMPLLALLQQPAFCIHETGTLHCNPAARHLAPLRADLLTVWLGSGAEAYDRWDRTGTLELTISLHGRTFTAAIQTLQDGTFFLLTEQTTVDAANAALSVASQVLRQPLSDLSVLTQRLSDQLDSGQQTDSVAAITRQIYHLSRLTGNLADLVRLHGGTYRMHLEMKDLNTAFLPLMQEIEGLCKEIGRELRWELPAKPMMLQADFRLLERAILNLISNAIKFGDKQAPITLRVEESGNYLLFQVGNRCSGSSTELLQAAFTRLEQRYEIPDPRWGIGLGLPITQYIARLHGGMVAVEASQDNETVVTISIHRKRPAKTPVLTSSTAPFSYSGGMRRSLMELAEVLPNHLFAPDAL